MAVVGRDDGLGELDYAHRDLSKQTTEHIALRDATGTGTTAIRLIDEHLDDGLSRLLAHRAIATAD